MSNTLSLKNASLYELDDELEALEAALWEADGVIDDETDERLDRVLDKREEKVEGYIKILRHFETQADAVKAERKRLQKKERSLRGKADRLKDRLVESMQRFGDTEYETPIGRVKRQKASRRSVAFHSTDLEPEQLPAPFKRTRVKPDKKKLAEALESDNEELRSLAENWAYLEPPSEYIRIY